MTAPMQFLPKKWDLPGEQFEESPGSGVSYSIFEGVVYANWLRPSKWDDDWTEEIAEAYELGFGSRMASWGLGLSTYTVDGWLSRGEVVCSLREQGLTFDPRIEEIADFYGTLYQRCMESKAQGVARRVSRIESARDWRAQAWLLERLVPEFAVKSFVNLNVDFSKLSDDELDRLAKTGRL